MEQPDVVSQIGDAKNGDVKNGDAMKPETKEINKQLLNSLAVMHDELDSNLAPAAYIRSLPRVIRRRIKALKKLQFETSKIESKFYEELHAIECKYANLYKPLYDKRHSIVSADVEPTDDECDWPSDSEDSLPEDLAQPSIDGKTVKGLPIFDENTKGIPDFWMQIFKNVDIISEMVEEHDEPILKHLQNVEAQMMPSNPMGFKLMFHFSPNEYFRNATLTKEYTLRCEPDPDTPLEYEGPEIIGSKGCTIDWKAGKCVTTKKVKKAGNHKGGQGAKKATMVNTASFFNFFSPPQVPEGEEPDDETEEILSNDFEVGHFLHDRVIPKAVLFYTGQALDEEEYEDDEDDGEVIVDHTQGVDAGAESVSDADTA